MISVVYVMDRLASDHIDELRRERCAPCRLPRRLRSL